MAIISMARFSEPNFARLSLSALLVGEGWRTKIKTIYDPETGRELAESLRARAGAEQG